MRVLSKLRQKFIHSLVVAIGTVWLLAGCGQTQSTLNPHGPRAANIALLWWVMLAIAVVICVAVVALLLMAVFRPRRRTADEPPRPEAGRGFIWIGGIVLPLVILIPLMGFVVYIDRTQAATVEPPRYTIEIVGHQWWWEVRYPDQQVVTANEIHIPMNEPVQVRLLTDDVIHSFWVPELHNKIDMIPGQVNTLSLQADAPGIYRGQCAEFCGLQHTKMALLVIAEPAEQFTAWLDAQSQPAPEPNDPQGQQGQQVFLGSACVYCHAIRGTNASGTLGPDLTHLASRNTLGAGILPNNPGHLGGWIINSQAIKPGNRMPPMYLDSNELQALLKYLESLK